LPPRRLHHRPRPCHHHRNIIQVTRSAPSSASRIYQFF
jgi:hypothetical protein